MNRPNAGKILFPLSLTNLFTTIEDSNIIKMFSFLCNCFAIYIE